jgi:hypothetical protein
MKRNISSKDREGIEKRKGVRISISGFLEWYNVDR